MSPIIEPVLRSRLYHTEYGDAVWLTDEQVTPYKEPVRPKLGDIEIEGNPVIATFDVGNTHYAVANGYGIWKKHGDVLVSVHDGRIAFPRLRKHAPVRSQEAPGAVLGQNTR